MISTRTCILLRNVVGSYRPFSASASASSASNGVTVSEEGGNVFHVKLARPEKMNTFTMNMWRDMKGIFEKLADDPKCRAIVLSAEGRAFCAGIDLKDGMGELIGLISDDKVEVGRKARAVRRAITVCQDGFTAIEKCPKPVIAAIHSHCLGAGIDLITACDVRYASQDTVFSIKEVDVGLAADVGTLNRIQKVVGNDSWTREISFTGRDFGVDEAVKFGLISRIFGSQKEVLEGALNLAKTIASKSPIAVQGTKEVLNYSRDHSIDDSLNFVKTWNMSQLMSTDLRDSAIAAMQKKKATYDDV